MRVHIFVLYASLLSVGAACSSPSAPEPLETQTVVAKDATVDTATPSFIPAPTATKGVQVIEPAHFGYTNQQADGNRLVSGQGSLPNSQYVDIALGAAPLWLVSTPAGSELGGGSSSVWSVVLEDGRVRTFLLQDGAPSEINSPPSKTGSNPPLLRFSDDRADFLISPATGLGLSPPAIIDEYGNWVYIDSDGDLVFLRSSGVETGKLSVDALPDTRILVDDEGRILLLTQPTERYGHGVLGDSFEAGAITLVKSHPEPEVILTIQIPPPLVIEGIAPLWEDINGDGRREIIVTLSDEDQGAQIVVYDEDGTQVAAGPAIGRGYRWRHQLAVGPFGPNGELELVDVLTPHIGGVVEYYRLDGNELKIVAQQPGYTSHVLGSRNLDMAVAADFDGEGNIELLLPNQARTELGAIRRTDNGAEVVWTLPLDGRLASNLSVVTTADGRLLLGAGREDGTLRIWQ
jgi:hypothetical protein